LEEQRSEWITSSTSRIRRSTIEDIAIRVSDSSSIVKDFVTLNSAVALEQTSNKVRPEDISIDTVTIRVRTLDLELDALTCVGGDAGGTSGGWWGIDEENNN
jgi:hypothetical protein